MILYQMAKIMEQRSRLQHTIENAEGDMEELLQQKEQVEEELMVCASRYADIAIEPEATV